MPPKRPANLRLEPTPEAPKTETGIGSDRFEGQGLVVDRAGMRLGEHDVIPGAVSFDDIAIIKKLGAGCSSTVQLARHKATGELYALKCISLFDKGLRDMLLTELNALFHSDCDALINFYGATYREGVVAVILEFMNLGGLDTVLRKAPEKKIPERVLAAMSFQMFFGLAYLAYEHRVHRDIKPQNILVNTEGQVKLTDFGISRELSTAVMAKTFIGTFKYMSPERITHQPYSFNSDIWSLGLVLLECALGRYPYPESKTQIAMVMILTEGEPPIPPRDGSFTDEFLDMITKCIARNPDARWSAEQLLEHPWFELHGIGSIDEATPVVKEWLSVSGFTDEYEVYRHPDAPAGTTATAAATSSSSSTSASPPGRVGAGGGAGGAGAGTLAAGPSST